MTALFVFALTLLAAVLVSDLADRSVLSTAVLFLLAGVVAGEGLLGAISLRPDAPAVAILAELALFSVLFTDGMRVGLKDLASAWRLPGRALLLGLPLTLVGTALLARWIVGLPWAESFLIGAVLSPTDPVFAAAIVGREEVPARLRQLLNVESGLNDGLALPIVVAMLAVIGPEHFYLAEVLTEVALGVGIGILVPWSAIRLEQSRFFSAHATYRPLNAFAIGLLVLTISSMAHANEFLAAFAAGITVATVGPEVREAFHRFGDLVAELLKLAALLVFGSLISPQFLGEIPASGYLFAPACARRGAAPRAVAFAAAQPAGVARAGRRRLVRPQGLRLRGLRPPDPEGGQGREVGLGAGRSAVPPRGALHRGVHRRALVDRHPRGPLVRSRTG